MPTVDVLSLDKKKVGSVELRDDVFAGKVNIALVHQVLKAQMAANRQGTVKTKTRSEVSGTKKKPYKQKGTGNARRGSNRSPLVVGGGVTHGPNPRNYEQKTPKEMVRGALRSVLADRMKENRILILENFELKDHKTKAFNEVLNKKLQLEKVLIVDEKNENLERSSRNVPHVKMIHTDGFNVYDVLKSEWLLITKPAAERLNIRLATDNHPRKRAKAAENKTA